MNQLQALLHQQARAIGPAGALSNGRAINHLTKIAPPLRDTKAAEPTAKQKKAKRRAAKQARRR